MKKKENQNINNAEIIGDKCYLRKFRMKDVNKNYLKWINDKEVTKYLESRFDTHSISSLMKYVKNILKNCNIMFFAIVDKEKNKHIGNLKIGPINKNHRFAEIGIMIGEKEYWGKGYGQEAIELAVKYSFLKLKLHKLTAGCYSNNLGSLNAFKKAKFKVECTQKLHYLYSNTYIDGIRLAIIKNNKK